MGVAGVVAQGEEEGGEVGHLRALCDDVFGQENFFAQIPWQSRTSVQNDTDLSVQHEYLVGYAVNRRREHRRLKESNVATWFSLPSFAAYPLPVNDERYHNPDDDLKFETLGYFRPVVAMSYALDWAISASAPQEQARR